MTTEASTGADLFVETLEQYGVTHVFGNPGTTELPLLRAIETSQLEYVLGLHEDIAVGMAGGYASTRRYHSHHDDSVMPVGVVNLHIAPGLAHGLGNLQNAAWMGAPLVVTAGNHSTDFQHEEPILGGDLAAMAEPFTKWSAEVQDVSALATMLRRAFRVALSPPSGPVFLGLPMDVMMEPTDATPERLGAIPSAGPGDPEQIAAAATAFADADRPALVVGDHVARAGVDAIEAGVELAESSGAAVYSEMLTCEINFPPDHEQWVSFVSPDVTMARDAFDADTLAFVGCSTNTPYIPYEEEYVPSDSTSIHVNEDPWEVAKNHSADVSIIGDSGAVMREIASAIGTSISAEERAARRSTIDDRRATARKHIHVERNDRDDGTISKAALADALRDTVPDALVVNESNTSKYPLLTRWPLGPEQFISNKNGGLGYGLPATLGATIATNQRGDHRPVVGFIGDGSYLYYPQSMYSASRYDLDVTVVVPNNRDYRILKDGMLQIYGGTDEDYEYVGMGLDDLDSHVVRNAESHGAEGYSVRERSALDAALASAVESDAPAVVDVHVHD